MSKFIMVIIYLALTVSGLILYKYGANKGFTFLLTHGNLEFKINIISIIGLICYLFSFLLYMFILPKFNISYIMPITSAISYIATFVLSILILKEHVTLNGIIGSIIILIGIIIINIKQ